MTKLTWGNPFTHEEHSRETVTAKESARLYGVVHECKWCGNERNVLFQYDYSKGLFCNKECHRSYYS